MNNFFRNTALLVVILIVSAPIYVMAQPGFDPGVPDGAPVDGGLSMLAIAGATYVGKKLYEKRKKTQVQDTAEE